MICLCDWIQNSGCGIQYISLSVCFYSSEVTFWMLFYSIKIYIYLKTIIACIIMSCVNLIYRLSTSFLTTSEHDIIFYIRLPNQFQLKQFWISISIQIYFWLNCTLEILQNLCLYVQSGVTYSLLQNSLVEISLNEFILTSMLCMLFCLYPFMSICCIHSTKKYY